MAFLAQEDRATRAELLREELFQEKIEFEHREDKDSGTLIEEKLYATDPDCLKVGRKVTSMAIFESTHSDYQTYGIDLDEYLMHDDSSDQDESVDENKEPNCSRLSLDFSMQAFEHLAGIQSRSDLNMEPETALEEFIPNGMDLTTFANRINRQLERNRTSWLMYNLATLYYRVVGKAKEAVECCRRAIHFSPKEHRSISLVDMGNILTHSHQQEDGIIVLHAAVDHTPSDPIAHYTLANSYALIGDLNR